MFASTLNLGTSVLQNSSPVQIGARKRSGSLDRTIT